MRLQQNSLGRLFSIFHLKKQNPVRRSISSCCDDPKVSLRPKPLQDEQERPQSKSDSNNKLLDRHFYLSTDGKGFKFAAINEQSFYCKDSRGNEENFGAPAGDFGEFLLALDCFKRLGGAKGEGPSYALKVDKLFEKWLNDRCSPQRPFYLHSDRMAMDRVGAALKVSNFSCPVEDLKTTEKRRQFLDLLSKDGAYHGCGHIRMILEDIQNAAAKRYEIGEATLSGLLEAFFNRLWRGDTRLLFKIYETKPDGQALTVIYGPDSFDKKSLIGLQCESSDGEQVFILNHHAVRLYRRDYLVPFFAALNPKIDGNDLFEMMELKGWRNAGYTADVLAKDKPVYRIDLSPSDT